MTLGRSPFRCSFAVYCGGKAQRKLEGADL